MRSFVNYPTKQPNFRLTSLNWKHLQIIKINVTQKQIIDVRFGRIEMIVGKGENAGDQHFLLTKNVFQKHSLKVPKAPK